MKKAERLVFHEKIGTMTEHMKRVEKIVALLANQLAFNDQEKKDLKRAANIYKFDLTTAMVGEFAELQGTMAGIYAKIFGENQTVCQALSEQYLPTSSEGDLPKSKVGAMLALADKLDTLFSFFTAGIIPSGSNDRSGFPYSRFLKYSLIGTFSWSTIAVWCGFFFGNITFVHEHFTLIILAIIVVTFLPALIAFLKTHKTKKAKN